MHFVPSLLVVLLATILLGSTLATARYSVVSARGTSRYQTDFFPQPIEQAQSSSAKWKQRVLVNSEFASGANAPTFLYLGPQGPVRPVSVTSGFVHDLAKAHGAHLLALEHRFNGESYPKRDLEAQNLKSLTVENALGDVARFIRDYTVQGKPLTNVVVFGEDYGGTIAAWLRVRNPELVVAAVAASATTGLSPQFEGYPNALRFAIAVSWRGGFDCAGTVARAINQTGSIIGSDHWDERRQFARDFGLCDSIADYEKWWGLQEATVAAVTRELAAAVHPDSIDELCSSIVPRDGESDVWAVGRYISSVLDRTGHRCLINDYFEYIATFNGTTIEGNKSGLRQEMYLACNDLGTFQAPDYHYAAGFPLFFYRMCEEAFGLDTDYYKERIGVSTKRYNEEFGGTHYTGKKVFFTHSAVDPMASPEVAVFAGEEGSDVHVLVSAGAARGAILGTATGGSLATDRATVAAQVATWLGGKSAMPAARRTPAATADPVSAELLRSLKL